METPTNFDETELKADFARLKAEINKVIIGQEGAITGIIIALLAGGHVLLEGVPGTGKTLLVRTISKCLSLDNKRVQFTPDLMPGDITGSLIYDNQTSNFDFRPGPVFTNLLLADEINRTPPKTQSALLETMEEKQVSIDGKSYPLPAPFMVLATENPIEFAGTYALPEAALDRFLFHLEMPMLSMEEEVQILENHANGFNPRKLETAGLEAVLTAEQLRAAQQFVQQVEVSTEVLHYIVALVRATRNNPAVELGVSPRGATNLLAAAKAWAWLQGRNFVIPDDVKTLVLPTMRHRLRLSADVELEGMDANHVLTSILNNVPTPR
ncbi:AAA family ATPase [Boudabousia tangfeifanii]|uniref:AAA family ATPase n=1 Tax=Boudabousia tangfeifanii TaxID=1912795 RepID=A0A1D9MJD9_9ACTO|nr:MoxR family ATPase [Boudabousia tangfeifanii]AOZ72461.1 AAA family ATPase [Boudabousia tangfeifanii]